MQDMDGDASIEKRVMVFSTVLFGVHDHEIGTEPRDQVDVWIFGATNVAQVGPFTEPKGGPCLIAATAGATKPVPRVLGVGTTHFRRQLPLTREDLVAPADILRRLGS